MGGANINFTSSTLTNALFVQTVAAGAPGNVKSNSPGYYYGNDPQNNTVGTSTAFWSAASLLRGRQYLGVNSWGSVTSTYGRQYLSPGNTSNAAGWIYPPAWAQVDINMGTTDTSAATSELTGNPDDTVNRLAQLGIATLGVEFIPCNDFAFQSLDQTAALYWRERWCAASLLPRHSPASHFSSPPSHTQGAVQAHLRGGRLVLEARHAED